MSTFMRVALVSVVLLSCRALLGHDGHDHPTTRPTTGPAAHLSAEDRKAFFNAARDGDLDTLKSMLEKEPLLVEARPDNDHRTPLIIAAWTDRADVAKLLIDNGADLEAEDFVWGASALGWCAWWGSLNVATVLIDAGAEINHPNRDGCTPLCSAKGALNYKPNPPGDATPEERSKLEKALEAKDAVLQQARTRPWPIVPGWDDIE